MSAPACEIVLAIEAAPIVRLRCENEGEEERLTEWIVSQPELCELVHAAIHLRDAAAA